MPWFHNVVLTTRLKDDPTREWYARKAIAGGWSRATLELNIRNRLHERQGQAVTNFGTRLQAPHSELAHDTLKDRYLFDFLGLGDNAHEREIENALVELLTYSRENGVNPVKPFMLVIAIPPMQGNCCRRSNQRRSVRGATRAR